MFLGALAGVVVVAATVVIFRDAILFTVMGAFIAALAAFMSILGLNLQKLAHIENMYYDPQARECLL